MSLVDGSSNSNKAIDNTTTPLSHTVNDALSALSDAAAAASAAVLTAASSGESSNSSEELGRQQNEDSVEQEKETGAEQGRVDGGRTASSRSPSNVTAQSTRMPDTVASAADALAVAPEASASMKSKQEDVNDSSTARGSHMDSIHSTHACHSVYPDSASAAAAADSGNTSSNSMTNVNNGSSASDVVKLSSGRRDSLNSESTSGSLKRPFSRVDELLEAAASPSSHSPATSSSIQSNKPSKVKKSSSSRDIHTVSSSIKDTRDSSLYNSTSSASGSTNNSATPANSTNQGDITAKPAVVSAPRKSAYQGPKISMACYSCRSSKTRCSGTQPCNRCELKRMECSYPLRDGRTANRNSLQTLSAVSSTQSITPPIPSLQNGYEPGAMERFNQAYALKVGNPHRSLVGSPGASHATPSVFHHQSPPNLSSRPTFSSSARSLHESLPTSSSSYQFEYPRPGSSKKQRTSPHAGDSDDQSRKRPSTGGSTTSRTHMSLPLNGTNGNSKSSRSPPEENLPPRLSSSYPHFHHLQQHQHRPYEFDHFTGDARPATAGASHYNRPVQIKQEDDDRRNSRDRSHSFPRPAPSYLKDYVLPLPSLRNTPLASPVIGARDGSIDDHHHEPERFMEGNSAMKESNALQLKEHRKPGNAHPEASAFSEAEPNYHKKSPISAPQQGAGLPYPSSTAYLPFSLQQHRYSPLFSAKSASYAQHHHMRGEDAYHAHAQAAITTVKREAESSPKIDELSATPSTATTPFEHNTTGRAEEESYTSEVDRSRASPPSTAATSLHSSIYGDASKADTPYTSTPTTTTLPNNEESTGPNIVGPAYLHSNNLLPPITGVTRGALPDTLLPWKVLLEQAGIPDLETLKSEIPFEAVKRYVDCLAESWPDVLPTFTKRFQLRYAIEDAITRACRDAPPKIPISEF